MSLVSSNLGVPGVLISKCRRAVLSYFLALASSLFNRSSVRFLAAARDAFLARADRSAGVRFLAEVLPPSLPYFLPICLK